jgi:NAD(P)-dependent dehydrogenase (short-subunit alcohol dehydrogenase family)
MTTKTAIVTGSNTGIGKATALGLARQGIEVVLAVRDVAKGEAAHTEIAAQAGGAAVRVMQLDLADTQSIRRFAAEAAGALPRLDILVNNAGLTTRDRQTTKDGFEMHFGVNHLGAALLTQELLPLLEKSAPARVVMVSSKMHADAHLNWDDLQSTRAPFRGLAVYSASKLANLMYMGALARRRLAGKGVTVNAVHPGVVASEMLREYPKLLRVVAHRFMISPARAAERCVYVATSPEVAGATGVYFHELKPRPASSDARDGEQQDRLWAATEELLRGTEGS